MNAERIYVDHGLTGTNRDRPGLREALAACRDGDTLVVTKLDRLARSLHDARDIIDELTHRHVKLSLGGSLHEPNDPVGRLLFSVPAMVAEFEADLIRRRTREGMRVAKAKGRLRGEQPKLNPRQEAHLVALHRAGEYSGAELGDLFGVARSTVDRAIERDRRRQQTLSSRDSKSQSRFDRGSLAGRCPSRRRPRRSGARGARKRIRLRAAPVVDAGIAGGWQVHDGGVADSPAYQGIGRWSRKKPPVAGVGKVVAQVIPAARWSTGRPPGPPVSVATHPGQTLLTRMHGVVSSAAHILVTAFSAALLMR